MISAMPIIVGPEVFECPITFQPMSKRLVLMLAESMLSKQWLQLWELREPLASSFAKGPLYSLCHYGAAHSQSQMPKDKKNGGSKQV